MVRLLSSVLCAGVAVQAAAIQGSRLPRGGPHSIRQTGNPYSLPALSSDLSARANDVQVKREGWQYGPSIAGNTSFYPVGTLADVATKADTDALFMTWN